MEQEDETRNRTKQDEIGRPSGAEQDDARRSRMEQDEAEAGRRRTEPDDVVRPGNAARNESKREKQATAGRGGLERDGAGRSRTNQNESAQTMNLGSDNAYQNQNLAVLRIPDMFSAMFTFMIHV